MPMSNTVGWDVTNKQTVMGGWGGLNKQQRNKQLVVYDKQTSGRRARTNKQIHIGEGEGGQVHKVFTMFTIFTVFTMLTIFTRSLVCSLIHSYVHSYVHSFTVRSLVCLIVHRMFARSHSRSSYVHIHVHRMFTFTFTACLRCSQCVSVFKSFQYCLLFTFDYQI